jgi:hypothetical protein
MTQEIPKSQWLQFFDDIGQAYEGWAVTVEAMARDLGDQPVISGLPLQGISFEIQGSQVGDILVEAGDVGSEFDVHRVAQPKRVLVSATQLGAEADIEIESEDGTKTLVRLRPQPELPGEGEQPGLGG